MTKVEPGTFQTDPVLWQTILGNVLGNAVAYAPAGSTIQIEASPHFLTVGNPAPNLAPEDIDFLFERFWRKNTAREGGTHSGLGLAIVETAVRLLGGTCGATTSKRESANSYPVEHERSGESGSMTVIGTIKRPQVCNKRVAQIECKYWPYLRQLSAAAWRRSVGRFVGLKIRAVVEGEFQKAVGAVEIQLVADVLAMIVHGADAQVQRIRDFFAGVILAN